MLNKRYHIIKNDDKSITYFEYDKIDGYDLTPKKDTKIADAINVNKLVIINPTLANKVAKKKIDLKFRKLVTLLNTIFESDSETGDALCKGLDELEKLKSELFNKYKKHLDDSEFDTMEKKLGILEHEIKVRLYYINEQYKEEKEMGRKTR